MLCTQSSVIVVKFRYILVLDMTMVVMMTILVATDDYLSGFHGCGIVPTMHQIVPHCTTLHLHHIVPTMHYIVPQCTKCYPNALHYTHNAPTMHHIVPTCTILYQYAPHCTRPAPTLSTQCAHCSTAHAPHTNLNPVLLGLRIYLSFYVIKKEKLVREPVKYSEQKVLLTKKICLEADLFR